MQTNVSGLLREFPKVKRAALAGERVTVKTREGNLVITAERPDGAELFGSMAERIRSDDLSPEDSGVSAGDWKPSL